MDTVEGMPYEERAASYFAVLKYETKIHIEKLFSRFIESEANEKDRNYN
jgi:hypothetical protein